MKKNLIFIIILVSLLFNNTLATSANDTYPKLANYFLKWHLSLEEARKLAKWDLLILDMEVQRNSPEMIVEIRKNNPDIIILAYITSQEILNNPHHYQHANLRIDLYNKIDDSWWLKDLSGQKISYWPNTSMLNLSDGAGLNQANERFNDFLPRFVVKNIKSSRLWDGVFYDNTWGDVSWVNGANIDIYNNNEIKSASYIDKAWSSGYEKMLIKTRELAGDDFIIVGNGRVHAPYLPHLHGKMLEGFPSYWESGGTWSGSVNTYIKMPNYTRKPALPIINTYNKDQYNFQLLRFSLASALLGDGYFSFDYDVTLHNQTWWYDEYDVYLGKARSRPYNLLDNNSSDIKPGMWRRDFDNGSVIINSTDKKQRIIFEREVFERIRGSLDSDFNNGQLINWLELEANDAIILLKKMNVIENSSFLNGEFFRVFSNDGKQTRAGFFSYLSQFPAASEVLLYDIDNDGFKEEIYSYDGLVRVLKNGQVILEFRPFHEGFRGRVSLALADLNNNGQLEIITGAGSGGGPQVRVYNLEANLVSTFFAFDPLFRGGIDIAAADTNNNGKAEIIIAAGSGGGPHLRIFDYSGKELSNFFVYNHEFKGGVKVASADLNNNGKAEIIVVPGYGMKPEVRIFNELGQKINSFLAYQTEYIQGLDVSASDSSKSGRAEIFVGIKDF